MKLMNDFKNFCQKARAIEGEDYRLFGTYAAKLGHLHFKKHMEKGVDKNIILKKFTNIGKSEFIKSFNHDISSCGAFKPPYAKAGENYKNSVYTTLCYIMSIYKHACIRLNKLNGISISNQYVNSLDNAAEKLLKQPKISLGNQYVNSLDNAAEKLLKQPKISLGNYELQKHLEYLSGLSADILAILSLEKEDGFEDYWYSKTHDFRGNELNKFQKVSSFSKAGDIENKKQGIFKRYKVNSFEELVKKYEKLRNQYEKLAEKKDIKNKSTSNIYCAIASVRLSDLYSNGFFEFPPSVEKMKDIINDRIVSDCVLFKSYDISLSSKNKYNSDLFSFYKKICSDLDEQSLISLYFNLKEKIDRNYKMDINIAEKNNKATDKLNIEWNNERMYYQNCFATLIFQKRKNNRGKEYSADNESVYDIIKTVFKENVLGEKFESIFEDAISSSFKYVDDEYIKRKMI